MKPTTDKEKALEDMIALAEELLPAETNLTDFAVKKTLVRIKKAKAALEGKGFKTLKAFLPGVELIAAVKCLRAALAHSPLGKVDASVGPDPFVPSPTPSASPAKSATTGNPSSSTGPACPTTTSKPSRPASSSSEEGTPARRRGARKRKRKDRSLKRAPHGRPFPSFDGLFPSRRGTPNPAPDKETAGPGPQKPGLKPG